MVTLRWNSPVPRLSAGERRVYCLQQILQSVTDPLFRIGLPLYNLVKLWSRSQDTIATRRAP